jgi:hypothetical protein
MAFGEDYCKNIKRFRYIVFIGWFAVVILGLKYAGSFTTATTSQYTSSHNSPSAVVGITEHPLTHISQK